MRMNIIGPPPIGGGAARSTQASPRVPSGIGSLTSIPLQEPAPALAAPPPPKMGRSAADTGVPRRVQELQLELIQGVVGSTDLEAQARSDLVTRMRADHKLMASMEEHLRALTPRCAVKHGTARSSHPRVFRDPSAPPLFSDPDGGTAAPGATWRHMPHAQGQPFYVGIRKRSAARYRGGAATEELEEDPEVVAEAELRGVRFGRVAPASGHHHHIDRLYARTEALNPACNAEAAAARGARQWTPGSALEAMIGLPYPEGLLSAGAPTPAQIRAAEEQAAAADAYGSELRAEARALRDASAAQKRREAILRSLQGPAGLPAAPEPPAEPPWERLHKGTSPSASRQAAKRAVAEGQEDHGDGGFTAGRRGRRGGRGGSASARAAVRSAEECEREYDQAAQLPPLDRVEKKLRLLREQPHLRELAITRARHHQKVKESMHRANYVKERATGAQFSSEALQVEAQRRQERALLHQQRMERSRQAVQARERDSPLRDRPSPRTVVNSVNEIAAPADGVGAPALGRGSLEGGPTAPV